MEFLEKQLKTLLRLGFILSLAFVANCNNENTVITGVFEPEHEPVVITAPPPVEPTILVWGNYFDSQSSGAYQDLLESCRRCGLKRVLQNPYGGVSYTRHYTFSSRDPKRCSNWGDRGYLQIEFKSNQLPTPVTVSFQPEYNNSGTQYWGEPFSVDSEAVAINENKGFHILLTPGRGLGGNKTLSIQSTSETHLDGTDIYVQVVYGRGSLSRDSEDFTIISQSLQKQSKKAIEKAQYSCSEYTN